jgi:hypothetical protein
MKNAGFFMWELRERRQIFISPTAEKRANSCVNLGYSPVLNSRSPEAVSLQLISLRHLIFIAYPYAKQ